MSNTPPIDPLDQLAEQIAQAHNEAFPKAEKAPSSTDLGFRMVSELLSGVAVGGMLGYWLDKQLDSTPWAFVICLLFGLAGGVLAMLRTANKIT